MCEKEYNDVWDYMDNDSSAKLNEGFELLEDAEPDMKRIEDFYRQWGFYIEDWP